MFPGARRGDGLDASYAIVGAPLERSTTFHPGTRFGPDRIRQRARGFEDFDRDTGRRFSELDIVDRGDVRGWQDAEAYLDFLAGEIGAASGVPVVLGGEHTVSLAAVRATEPDAYVCVDAHLDLREAFDDDPWSHATVTHHVRERGIPTYLVGTRAGSEEEWARAEADVGVTVITPEELAERIPELGALDGDLYLSIDIDGVDPGFAPGTGTPEPYGLGPRDVRAVIRAVARSVVGADVVEVNDRDDGQAATLAGKFVRDIVFAHAGEAHG